MRVPRFSCDFETNNYEDDCRVWSWGIDNIYTGAYSHGETLDEFMNYIQKLSSCILYFHNLKFDGSFIVNWLLRHGYTHVVKKNVTDELKRGDFTTLISDMGQWYTVEIQFRNGKNIRIIDSVKILASDLAGVAKSFGMEEGKGEIDYEKYRPIGYKATKEELHYQMMDCKIMSTALKYMLESRQTHITAGSNALADYKFRLKKNFERWFPQLDDMVDEFIRSSYRGGWVYANPDHKRKVLGEGLVLDINSLYPYEARTQKLPYGKPQCFSGEYELDKNYPLYVQRLKCKFEIKRGKLPTIQIKKSSRFLDTEYVSSSNGEIVELTLTSVDLSLFFDHYKVTRIEWLGGYKFRAANGMFDEYIDYWTEQKIHGAEIGDYAKRTLSKLMMNSLIGKFGKRPKGRSKIPYLEDDTLRFKLGDEERQGSLYIPIACFVLAYARDYIIRSAQKNKKRFCYADTDSLHLVGKTMPKDLDIDAFKLGSFKIEHEFRKAKFVGAKCYIEDVKAKDDEGKECWKLNITCAGLPHKLHKDIKFEDFDVGMKIDGKLLPKQVKFGVILKKTTFELKERKF